MELNEYQRKAMTTCMDSCNNFSYMMLNLVGEMGEFASKVAKQIRKETLEISNNELLNGRLSSMAVAIDMDESLRLEAGDILWQLSGLCQVMGLSLEEVARENLDKLAARKKAGTIDGNGDNR